MFVQFCQWAFVNFFQQFLIDRVINTSWDDINYAKKRGSETKMKVGPRLKSETCNTRRVVGLNRRIMYVHGLAILAQTWARKLSLILPISEVNETICITRTGWPTNLIQFLCVCLSQLAPWHFFRPEHANKSERMGKRFRFLTYDTAHLGKV